MGCRSDLHPTKEGWLYLAVVLDLYARLVVGWAMDARMPTELPLEALSMALKRRSPAAGLIHQGDQGSQYAARRYQAVLTRNGAVPSMSRRGDCWEHQAQRRVPDQHPNRQAALLGEDI